MHKIVAGVLILLSVLKTGYGQVKEERCRIVFYNVENLFDVKDDPNTSDDDFTPHGKRHWGKERYHSKIRHISEVLSATGEGELPVFIGLAEVENREVLEDLIGKTVLADGGYGIVHADSPDPRGIDVAFLYRKPYCQLLKACFFPVFLEGVGHTRDVLYCKGVIGKIDTLHFFVAHFPSMRGGESQSEWKRVRAAKVIRQRVDSIQAENPRAAIVIMGDLNGKANTIAQKAMKTKNSDARKIKDKGLYNTGYYLLRENHGSYRYKGVWQTIDHLILSGVLLNGKFPLQASRHLTVGTFGFLFEEDKKYYGVKPKPTYRGPYYVGGYSDHLPIYIDLKK
ncbi:endonuclease/exonuclease/phosphatase family protein [Gabonibacter massiliensis]|uniref:endonuclease/exonuclease/phosphatase family protein n=1 Tax=Gabonibacter massiliensis TaxID=1720195 RepID=UPI00073F8084|nr:endonuclease/exonuclease/phosphatase family protein [Gabonibacter massiliensis]